MRAAERAGSGVLFLLGLACGPLAPSGSRPQTPAHGPGLASGGVTEKVTGGGQFVHPTFGSFTVSFVAIRHSDGRVTGQFQQHQPAFDFTYQGVVTCFAVDPVNHRAWIGGVLTHSNDPDPITEVGDDAWFRVLDTDGSAEPDRTTFLGFEGGGGIITSEEYCQARIWPEENARTWPMEQGAIVIH